MIHAEQIIYNGTIHTLNPAMPTAEAVALANGRILAVGTLEDIEATVHSNTRRLNLRGRTLLPGFHMAHVDLIRIAAALTTEAEAADDSFEGQFMAGAKHLLRLGITSISHVGLLPDQLDIVRKLANERRMPLRANVLARRYTDQGDKLALPERYEGKWLRIDTVHILADEPDGRLRYRDDQLTAIVWDIHRAGLRAAIQAYTHEAAQQAIRAIEFASQRLASHLQHRIEVCALPTPDMLQTCRQRRIALVIAPTSLSASQATPVAPVTTATITVPLFEEHTFTVALGAGFDSAMASLNPLAGMAALLAHARAVGAMPNTLDVVRTAILGGAYLSAEDRLKGTIVPTKFADLVVLSGDPLRAPLERLTDLNVEATLVEGHTLYSA